MRPIQLLTLGYPGFDVIMRINRSPAVGETAIILEPPGINKPTPGGCAPNIAVAASRLGVGAAPVMVVGDDTEGKSMRSYLEGEGVDTSCVHLIAGGKTPHTFLFVDPDSGHQTYYYPGAADDPIHLDIPASIFQQLRFGVVTVGNPLHTEQFVEAMIARDVPLVWSLRNDPHAFPLPLVKRLVSASQLLFMNQYEADQLLALLKFDAMESLFQVGVEAVILTLGTQGSRILLRDTRMDVPAVKPDAIVDPTGAGDAFVGGMLSGLCMGADMEMAARLGAVTASFVLEDWGCQTRLPTLDQAAARYTAAFGTADFLVKGA